MSDLQKTSFIDDLERDPQRLIDERKSKLEHAIQELPDTDPIEKDNITMKHRLQLELDAMQRDPDTWVQITKSQAEASLAYQDQCTVYRDSYKEWLSPTETEPDIKR